MGSEAAYFPDALSRTVEVCDGLTTIPSESLPEPSSDALDEPAPADKLSGMSDGQLMKQICDGVKEALGVLFRRHARAVCNVAYRILRDGAEAEDLCQEVFLSLFQKAHLFNASKGTASSWIIQIAYHRAMNRRGYLAYRHHYNAQEFDEECTVAEGPQLLIDEIAAKTLLERLRGQLSPEQRATLEFHFFEGYSLREIAKKTNQPLGNVRHHYYRGLERLRSIIFPKRGA
jgi:RNA polymerase sigma-70 factor (ECF subfamily)